MPGMTGLETFEKLHEINPSIKAIVASGMAGAKKLEDQFGDRIFGVLHKPIDRKTLLGMVGKILN